MYEGIIKLHTRVNNYGFALSMREDAVIVSNWSSCNLTAYDVNTSEVLWTVGSNGTGELQFRSPMKLCCAPDNGNILVAEDTNNRVQELTPDGGFVRFLGVGVITTASYGISASADLIAIGAWSSSADEQITILDRSTGALVRRFANGGSFPGQLLNVYGLRFSRDGRQLYCVEIVSHRVSVFTTDGEFLRIITDESLGQVGDVDFARNGDIIITNRSRNQIAVFSPAGVLLRSFGSDSMFAQPTALAVSRSGSLYVLDLNAARVQVFT